MYVMFLHCLERERGEREKRDNRLAHVQREGEKERERWPIRKLIRKCIVMITKYWLNYHGQQVVFL